MAVAAGNAETILFGLMATANFDAVQQVLVADGATWAVGVAMVLGPVLVWLSIVMLRIRDPTCRAPGARRSSRCRSCSQRLPGFTPVPVEQVLEQAFGRRDD